MISPTYRIGDVAQELARLVEQGGAGQVLLVAGGHFLRAPKAGELRALLGERLSVEVATPQGLLQEEELMGLAARLPAGIDAVIAIGGGRSIDCAKALLYYARREPRLFAAVPTTAGSGSDATSFAVVYRGIEKLSLEHPALLPGAVVWDVALLRDLPQRQRAHSGLDALVQCVEALWSRLATPASSVRAWEAGSWLRANLPAFVQDPHNDDLALGTLYAAHGSGAAIQQSRTTGAHALSYYLTAVHGVDHGHAVALLLPVFLRYNALEPAAGFEAALQLLGATDGDTAARDWQAYVQALGVPARFSDLGLSSACIPEWFRNINAGRFANNPVPFRADALEAALRATW
ncbi:MAG: iron-containing alcohol dehydrogenase [Chitinophagaceae bacterium]|nr:MAG: iron-containing alcohol dehydrogenase [Chitinophagaceae bacterium]